MRNEHINKLLCFSLVNLSLVSLIYRALRWVERKIIFFLSYNRNSFFFFFVFLPFLGSVPVALGGSQARGLIRGVAAGLRQSHSNVGSKLRL